MNPSDIPDPDAGWLGLAKASSAVLAPVLIIVGIVSLAALAAAVWPTPPALGAITTARRPIQARSSGSADTTGWSDHDQRALMDASAADVRRLVYTWRTAAGGGTGRTGLIPLDDSLSWAGLERSHGAETRARGLVRDTTFHPFPAGSASRAALWTYHDWAGQRVASGLALIDVPRPSTGTRVRFVVEMWSEPWD